MDNLTQKNLIEKNDFNLNQNPEQETTTQEKNKQQEQNKFPVKHIVKQHYSLLELHPIENSPIYQASKSNNEILKQQDQQYILQQLSLQQEINAQLSTDTNFKQSCTSEKQKIIYNFPQILDSENEDCEQQEEEASKKNNYNYKHLQQIDEEVKSPFQKKRSSELESQTGTETLSPNKSYLSYQQADLSQSQTSIASSENLEFQNVATNRVRGNSFSINRQKKLSGAGSVLQIQKLGIEKRKMSDPLKKKIVNIFSRKYDELEKIGEGCHAVVKRCRKRDDPDGIDLAVKIIRYKDIEILFQIIQEYQIISQLNHPTIVRYKLFEIDKEKKTAYLVTEYAKGEQLSKLIESGYKFNEKEIRIIFNQLAAGLQYIHSKKICHRDFTSNNIIYDKKTQKIKIIDFNVSKQWINLKSMMTNTGTHLFKAPEQFKYYYYDKKIDIWALGVVLYYIVTGEYPFNDPESNFSAIIDQILNNEPDLDKIHYDQDLKNLISRMLDKNPETRIYFGDIFQNGWIKKKLKQSDFSQNYQIDVQTSDQQIDQNQQIQQNQKIQLNFKVKRNTSSEQIKSKELQNNPSFEQYNDEQFTKKNRNSIHSELTQ